MLYRSRSTVIIRNLDTNNLDQINTDFFFFNTINTDKITINYTRTHTHILVIVLRMFYNITISIYSDKMLCGYYAFFFLY